MKLVKNEVCAGCVPVPPQSSTRSLTMTTVTVTVVCGVWCVVCVANHVECDEEFCVLWLLIICDVWSESHNVTMLLHGGINKCYVTAVFSGL